MRFLRDSFAALHQMLAGVPKTERDAAWNEIGQELRQFEGPGGLEISAELLVGAAVK